MALIRASAWASRGAALLIAGVLGACQTTTPPIEQPVPDELSLPADFAIEVYAKVPGARSLAVADGGARVYVGTKGSKVFVIRDDDRDGVADDVSVFADGFVIANGVAVADDGSLYVADVKQIVRFRPDGRRETVLSPGVLPDFELHGARYIGFGPDGWLYVALGAPCNICKVEGLQGTIIRLRADGEDLEIFARGVRNSVGFDWHPVSGELFFTDNGGDYLGDLIPPDELNRAPESGLHFGYPYVYGQNIPYPEFADVAPPAPTTPPALEFEAHVAALGIHFYQGAMFPEGYQNDALVAQHGSWNRSTPIGYRIMRVRFEDGAPVGKEVFIDGWLGDDGQAWGRPVDLEELPDGSLLISDDRAGLVYRVTYQP